MKGAEETEESRYSSAYPRRVRYHASRNQSRRLTMIGDAMQSTAERNNTCGNPRVYVGNREGVSAKYTLSACRNARNHVAGMQRETTRGTERERETMLDCSRISARKIPRCINNVTDSRVTRSAFDILAIAKTREARLYTRIHARTYTIVSYSETRARVSCGAERCRVVHVITTFAEDPSSIVTDFLPATCKLATNSRMVRTHLTACYMQCVPPPRPVHMLARRVCAVAPMHLRQTDGLIALTPKFAACRPIT